MLNPDNHPSGPRCPVLISGPKVVPVWDYLKEFKKYEPQTGTTLGPMGSSGPDIAMGTSGTSLVPR